MYNGNITIRHTFNNNSGVHYPRKSKIKNIVCNKNIEESLIYAQI